MSEPVEENDAAAVVIGASVGAIAALSAILPELPAGYPLPVIVVVHLPPDRRTMLPELFAERCELAVKEAEDKERILPGTIYFAPPNYHLLVEPELCFSLSNEEPVHFSRPSIDVLFESAADAYGTGLTGVMLTGASNDGARGLKRVRESGGRAYVQEPASAESEVMPLAALAACPTAQVLGLKELSIILRHLVPDA